MPGRGPDEPVIGGGGWNLWQHSQTGECYNKKGALANRLQNPKWPPGGPKMVEGVWKGVHPSVLGGSKQLLLNKFFDPTTPSMRKGRDGGNGRRKKNRENRKKKGKKRKDG